MTGKKNYTKFDFKLVEMAINLSSYNSPQTSSLQGNKVSTYVSTTPPCLFLSSLRSWYLCRETLEFKMSPDNQVSIFSAK